MRLRYIYRWTIHYRSDANRAYSETYGAASNPNSSCKVRNVFGLIRTCLPLTLTSCRHGCALTVRELYASTYTSPARPSFSSGSKHGVHTKGAPY